MEIKVSKDNLLKLEVRTLSKNIFNQLPELRYKKGMKFIGWVNSIDEWYLMQDRIQDRNIILKIRRRDLWDYYTILFNTTHEDFIKEAVELRIGSSLLTSRKMDELRDSLPQIFLK